MEWLILTIGAKFCCIAASGVGGLANWAVKKSISWRDLVLAVLVGWAAAEFFIPPCNLGSSHSFYDRVLWHTFVACP